MIHGTTPSGELKDESIETPLAGRGAGIIFHIRSSDEFMFFLRDDKAWIPFPDMVDIIGGHMEDEDETPEEAAMRELGEELEYSETGEPFQPTGLTPFRRYVDGRNVEQNIFGCELDEKPNLLLKEGQRLVFLKREQLDQTDFAFDYNDVVAEYAASV